MNELQAQRMVVEAIRDAGGFAFKLSNRFLAGVPDLLVQPKDLPTSIWECKIGDVKKVTPWPVVITPLQNKFLNNFDEAGGFGGVISFMRGKNYLAMAAIPYRVWAKSSGFHPTVYRELFRGHRHLIITEIINGAYESERNTAGSKSQRCVRLQES